MQITIYLDGDVQRAQDWRDQLSRRLPGSTIRVWQPGDDGPTDYLLVWKPPAQVLMQRPGLKAIVNLAAGVDTLLDVLRANPGLVPPQVPILRMEDAGMAAQMVDFARYQVLRFFRRMHDYDGQGRAQQWAKLAPETKETFAVGVMGLGVLGAEVAAGVAALGFPVRGWSRSAKTLEGIDCHAGEAALPGFLRGLRVLINMLPLTPQTENVLDRALFDQLDAPAYVVNIGRGQHLVEADLLDAIARGQIGGAALDVFRVEPLPSGHPFWQEPRIAVTPHIAAVTLNDAGVQQVVRKLQALQSGAPVSGVVDLQRGY